MQDAKEEVRSRLNIEDVVGEYVQLKRAGRNFKGLSPFSGEKTPSFFVSPDKHIWHDFSSNKGGDVFSFIMEVEGFDFKAALEYLARKANVDLSVYQTKGSQDFAKRKKRLFDAHAMATRYYQHSLLKNQHALEYVFKTRNLSRDIVQNFGIGYAPTTGNALVQFLLKKGFTKKELADGGLTNRFGGDMFRGRMAVPLMDSGGQTIGFTARILTDEPGAPKYLNTPQTVLYDKSRHVFGLSQAKEAIRANDYAVIVEGNLDVVSSHQANVKQVVATAGTAITEHHLRTLRRLTGNVRLAFDGDKAGIAATERAIPIASEVGVELSIITLPNSAKDPDELIQQDVSLWKKAIENAVPATDWILDYYARMHDVATAAGKRAFTTAGLAIINGIHDSVEREHYERKIADMASSSLEAIRAKREQSAQNQQATLLKKPVKNSEQAVQDAHAYQDNVLSLALIDSQTRRSLGESADLFIGDDRQTLARYLAENPTVTARVMLLDLQSIDTYVKILLLKADTRYAEWSEQDRIQESARLLRQLINEHRKQTQQQLVQQLREAEAADDELQAEALRQKLNTLIKEMTRGR